MHHVSRPIGGFKLVINLPWLVLAVAIVAKCKEGQRNNEFGVKNINLATTFCGKQIAGENFYLALERHIPLKVIDLCYPCIS